MNHSASICVNILLCTADTLGESHVSILELLADKWSPPADHGSAMRQLPQQYVPFFFRCRIVRSCAARCCRGSRYIQKHIQISFDEGIVFKSTCIHIYIYIDIYRKIQSIMTCSCRQMHNAPCFQRKKHTHHIYIDIKYLHSKIIYLYIL